MDMMVKKALLKTLKSDHTQIAFRFVVYQSDRHKHPNYIDNTHGQAFIRKFQTTFREEPFYALCYVGRNGNMVTNYIISVFLDDVSLRLLTMHIAASSDEPDFWTMPPNYVKRYYCNVLSAQFLSLFTMVS